MLVSMTSCQLLIISDMFKALKSVNQLFSSLKGIQRATIQNRQAGRAREVKSLSKKKLGRLVLLQDLDSQVYVLFVEFQSKWRTCDSPNFHGSCS